MYSIVVPNLMLGRMPKSFTVAPRFGASHLRSEFSKRVWGLLWFAAALTAVIACTRGVPPAAAGPAPERPDRAALAAALEETTQVVLQHALADSAFPGAFAVIGDHSGVLAEEGVGHLDWAPSPVPDEHTMYDLASLSKVIGMTTGIMQLVEEGKVDLDAPVQRYLPTWTGPNKEKVTLRHLITHTSGLPPDWPAGSKPYDEITTDPDSIGKLMFNTPLDTVPGVRMVYSDIGAFLLGRIIEQITGVSLDIYLHDHEFRPLGMNETMYRPPVALRPRIAPTEFDPRRGGLVRGMVHDERAYYLGGVSAHAGLFSTGHDLARFARMYLNGGELDGVRVVQAATIRQFTKRQVEDRAIGWQKPDGKNSAGHLMSEEAFGHTGFTGTSIWIDPPRDIFVILLSNRVDPTRRNTRLFKWRVALADGVESTLARLHASPSTSH